MKLDYTVKLQKIMADSGYLLAIRDNFESLLTKSVFSIVEAQLKNNESDTSLKKKIFSVVVECVQNICFTTVSHSTEKNSILLFNKIENGHKIIVGSLISEEKKDRLNHFLEELSNSSIEELKSKRTELLSSKIEFNESHKENLALMEMYIRSKSKIKYHFQELENNKSFLIIEIEISTN